MFIWYEDYKGGTNNLTIVMSHNVCTSSTKGKEKAIENHHRKLSKLGLI